VLYVFPPYKLTLFFSFSRNGSFRHEPGAVREREHAEEVGGQHQRVHQVGRANHGHGRRDPPQSGKLTGHPVD